jgi:CheY-like chemotaxis protein
LGYAVEIAADGAEALELAERFLPQLILLDIEMPKLSGHQVTERIRDCGWGKEIFIIAMTALSSQEDRQRSLSAGCNEHLVKPFAGSDLASLLGRYEEELRTHQALEALRTRLAHAELRRVFEETRIAFDHLRQARDDLDTNMSLMQGRSEFCRSDINYRDTQRQKAVAYGRFMETEKALINLIRNRLKDCPSAARN